MREFVGESIVGGEIEAEILVTQRALLFNNVDINTGIVHQENSEMNGKTVTGKIIVAPNFMCNIDMWRLYGLCKKGLGPSGIISPCMADDYMIVGAILSKLPLVHKAGAEDVSGLRDGQLVRISGNKVSVISR